MKTLSQPSFWVFTFIVVFIVALRTKNGKLLGAVIAALIGLGIADLISFEIIKPLVARERPCWLLADVKIFDGRCGGSYGFTSNHAANAFAVWTIIAKIYGFRSLAAQTVLTIATAVAISRVYLGVHFVGDIVGGAILGIVVSASLWSLGLSRAADHIANFTTKNAGDKA